MYAALIVAEGLWTAALPAVATGVLGVVARFLGQRQRDKGEIDRLTAAIDAKREERFGAAQVGYRALYQKFAKHYERGDLEELRGDLHEAEMVGFEALNAALSRFWPDNHFRLAKARSIANGRT